MRRTAAIIFAVVVGLSIIGCSSVGLRRSDGKIHASLMALTPLGSTPEQVLAFVKQQGWRHSEYHPNTGFLKQERPEIEVVGASSINASLGDYHSSPFLITNVSAFWGFDQKRRLIEIWIWRTTDGP